MISNLSLVGCYNKSYVAAEERDRIILESAKHNLASMAFFYLTEYQKVRWPALAFGYIRYVRELLMIIQ